MDRQQQGAYAEQRQILAWMKRGYDVFTPTRDGAEIDYIISGGDDLYRCQSKKVSKSGPSLTASVVKDNKSKGEKLRYQNIDLFVLYWPQKDNIYVARSEGVNTSSLTIRVEKPQKGENRKYRWHKDHLIEEFPEAERSEKSVFSPSKKDRGAPNDHVVSCDYCGDQFERKPHHQEGRNYCCQECYARDERVDLPSKEWLEDMKEEYTIRQLCRHLGVSHGTIYRKIKGEYRLGS